MISTNEKKFKVIILSENVNFRNIAATKLRLEGFFVEIVSGGFHLLHLIENEKIDMAIINDDMKDMPTHEAIALVRSLKNKNELPIVYVSNKNDEEEIYNLINLGANDYIVQTSNYLPLIERANRYFNQKKPLSA